MNPDESDGGIPFTFLCSLFREISQIKPRGANVIKANGNHKEDHPALQVFQRWLKALNERFKPLPEGTIAACLRLLFPEEDVKRKYDMQETRLTETLAKCYGIDPKKFSYWNADEASGCLGSEVRSALEESNSNTEDYIGPLSISQVDELLNELASLSGFSDASIRLRYPKHKRRTRLEIIRHLYRNASPDDASYITQIILKDLRPLLYPLAETHFTAALKNFNTKSVRMLTKEDVMLAWDPSGVMLKACRLFSNLELAANIFAMPPERRPPLRPTPGVMIEIPKSRKATSCHHGLSYLQSSRQVWAETKYDGERAQIHVELQGKGPPKITIFSKSKRESTLDRHGVHDIVRTALGFGDQSSGARIQQNVILDAEMVAFNGERVDEFWRIRRLIENTAYGVHVSRRSDPNANVDPTSQTSMLSDDDETRHLGLIFFDILMLDSTSLLWQPYGERRRILESIILPSAGRAILAQRFAVDMTLRNPVDSLRTIFSDQIADHQEGLVLKAQESCYNESRLPWVKLKKDYIPGYGDTVDMIVAGASWEKDRARELRVGPDTFTTFYIGALRDKMVPKPHIEVIFTASFGLNREKLEQLNFMIRASNTTSLPLKKGETLQHYTFSLYPGLEPPSVIFHNPLLVELFGAGFTKSPKSLYYELRFPRMTKVYRQSERGWREGLDLRSLHEIACKSVGRDRSNKDIDDYTRQLFGKPCSPGAKCPLKRKVVAEEWEEKLRSLDRKHARTSENASSLPRLRPNRSNEPRADIGRPQLDVDAGPLTTVTNRPVVPPSPSPALSPTQCNQPGDIFPIASPKLATQRIGKLLTPSSSPVRARTQQSTTVPTISRAASSTPVPVSAFQNTHVWFMRSDSSSSCKTCSQLRREIPRERKIHSLDSLLLACGWGQSSGSLGWLHQAAIVVDDHEYDSGARLEDLLRGLRTRRANADDRGGERKDICVYRCTELASGRSDPVCKL